MDNYPRRNQQSQPYNAGGPFSDCFLPGADLIYPGCGQPVEAICKMDVIGNAVVVAPQAVFTLRIAPLRSNFYQVLAIRNVIQDNLDPQVGSRVDYQSWTVNQQPILGFSTAPVLIGNTTGISSDLFEVPCGYGVPQLGYIVSQNALVNTWDISGVNREPLVGGLTLRVQMQAYGNAISQCPAGWNARFCRPA